MEFSQGRGGGYNWDEEDRREAQKRSPFGSASSSSSCSVVQRGARVEEGREEPSAAAAAPIEKEHMFDKVVTPSDVGKLNRLVIPKQHAEKYFPLDAAANEKGLLLNFEDRTGKPWRFRYSYWNSSQSYVMTKGWSRFVKEKRLDAGDTVSFGRGVGEAGRDRLFIDWKHRPDAHDPARIPRLPLPPPSGVHGPILSFARSAATPWGGRLFVPPQTPPSVFDHRNVQQGYAYNAASTSSGVAAGQYVYLRPSVLPHVAVQRDAGTNAGGSVPIVLDSVPVASNRTMGKRVRLFGVNLNCPESDSDGDVRATPPLQLRLGWAESSNEQQQQ